MTPSLEGEEEASHTTDLKMADTEEDCDHYQVDFFWVPGQLSTEAQGLEQGHD